MRTFFLLILVCVLSTAAAPAQIIAIHFDGAGGDVTAATGVVDATTGLVTVNADQWNN
jgi:hypothetical protein